MDIKDKVRKDEETLIQLKEKKAKLDEKIAKLEERIENNKVILNDMKFTEINNVIKSKGLSVDEILQAVKNGDLLAIQDKLEQRQQEQENENQQQEQEKENPVVDKVVSNDRI